MFGWENEFLNVFASTTCVLSWRDKYYVSISERVASIDNNLLSASRRGFAYNPETLGGRDLSYCDIFIAYSTRCHFKIHYTKYRSISSLAWLFSLRELLSSPGKTCLTYGRELFLNCWLHPCFSRPMILHFAHHLVNWFYLYDYYDDIAHILQNQQISLRMYWY